MKYKLALTLAIMSWLSLANSTGYIDDFNYQLTDINDKNLKKEVLFKQLLRDNVDLKDAICANKAHVWGFQIERKYDIRTGKIFVFFGRSAWKKEKKGWMYHVAPYVVENNKEWVLEASYPNEITRPLKVTEWLENETDGRIKASQCIEISAADSDLTEYFYERYNLPEKRKLRRGAVCYFRKVPGYYWFPASIAYHDLKKDEKGQTVSYNPNKFDKDDVLKACIEILDSKIGRLFGGNKKECKKLLGL
jgi:hypothetical protein